MTVAAGQAAAVTVFWDRRDAEGGRVTTSLYLVPAAAIVISLVWLG